MKWEEAREFKVNKKGFFFFSYCLGIVDRIQIDKEREKTKDRERLTKRTKEGQTETGGRKTDK